MDEKERFALMIGVGLCFFVFGWGVFVTQVMKPTYTVEVYEIFEVDHKSNSRQTLTCVYTYGQGQFFFRGDHDINESKSYTFVYQLNGRRWRDLTLLDYYEINVLEREEDCPDCPN
jgi:hypothetical protein